MSCCAPSLPVDEQFRLRHALLLRWADALRRASTRGAGIAARRLRAGRGGLRHARMRPVHAGAVTSLRLAEEILSQARARLPAPAGDERRLRPSLRRSARATPRWPSRDASSTRRVQSYNRAVAQFPTWVLAGLFGFRKAGTL